MKFNYALFTTAAMCIAVSSLQGCNSVTHMVKNIESDLSELNRDIAVMNSFTGDTIFKYSGPCYFETDSGGSIALIYKVNGISKKADFAGNFVFTAVEK